MSTADEPASSAKDAIAVAAEGVASEVRQQRRHPGLRLVLALDGGSAAGKTVLTQRLAGYLHRRRCSRHARMCLTTAGISRNTLVSSNQPEHAATPAWRLGSKWPNDGHREGDRA